MKLLNKKNPAKLVVHTVALALFLSASAGLMAQPMSGTYTVCASGCDYSTVGDAATALNTNGVSGAVTINIAAGVYAGPVVINNVSGASATNTITFKGAGASVTKLTFTQLSGTVILLNGSRYVSIEDMAIEHTGSAHVSYRRGVWANKAVNCIVKNCNISMKVSSAGSTDAIHHTACDSMTYENNTIRGGNYGVYISDSYFPGNPVGTGHKIARNTITRFYYYGIYLTGYSAVGNNVIDGNNIDSAGVGVGHGIRATFPKGLKIVNNHIGGQGMSYGISIIDPNTYDYSGSIPLEISNNFIYACNAAGYPLLVSCATASNVKISHNTAHLTNTSSASKGAFIDARYTSGFEFTNNSIGRSTSGYIASIQTNSSANLTGNNFYNNSSSFDILWNLTQYTTLASYNTASGDNAQNMAMPFLSSTDLHLDPNQPAPLSSYNAGISTDIDGDARSTTSPTIGADESEYNPCTLTAHAGSDQTVYYGYSPLACATLTASGSNGTGALSYSWSTNANTQSITVCPSATTNYIVTITDSQSCTATDTVSVNVVDVRCGNNMDKVLVCHNGNVICVSASAVAAHLNHGCNLGSCPSLKKEQEFAEEDIHPEHAFTAYPNPFRGTTNIEFTLAHDANVALEVYDLKGAKVAMLYKGESEADEVHRFEFNGSAYGSSMYIVKMVSGSEVKYLKIIMVE